MKKLLNRKQKGFTIVELVIVIAVIGILAGVLIPVFINLNNKANKAADEALVKNLNTALATQEQEPGDSKNATFHDAVVDLKEYGYLLPNLVAKSDEDLLWDRETNRFLLEEDAKSDKTLDYWRIQDNLDEQKYNVYAGPKFNATSVTNLKVGFDAGDYEGLTSVSYVGNGVSAQDVIIRTNGGMLTVDAENDTLKHYGNVDALDIKAIKDTSYREFGIVGYAKIAKGRLVVEESSQIDGIYLVANSSGEFDGIKLAVVGGAQLPELARADVALNDGQSKLVVEVQTLKTSEGVDENPEYIWISKTGSEVNSTVSSSNNASDYAAHVVPNPTPSAAAAKEETKASAAPIDETTQVRIGAVGYATFDEAVAASKKDDVIVLLKDITYGTDRIVPVWGDATVYVDFDINLGGNTFTTNSNQSITLSNNGYKATAICYSPVNSDTAVNVTVSNGNIRTAYGAGVYADDNHLTLTIKNVDITQNYPENVQSTDEYSTAIRLTSEAKVVIESGSFRGKHAVVVSNSGGTVVINGGTFNSDLFFSSSTNSGVTKSITINGGTFNNFNAINADKGTLVINGGTFSSNEMTLTTFSTYLGAGKTVTTNADGSWTVQ